MTNEQLVTRWAEQRWTEGRANHLSFDGPRLYSYRLPIAEIYPGVTFIIDEAPTRTTAKHLYLARHEAPGIIIYPQEIARPHYMLQQVADRLAQEFAGLWRKSGFVLARYAEEVFEWRSAQERLKAHPEITNLTPPPPPPNAEDYFFPETRPALREETTPPPAEGKIKRAFAQYNFAYLDGAIREPITTRRLSPLTDEPTAWRHAARYLKGYTAADVGARLASILLRNQEG